ncbi:MAG: thioredoxin domain-containing protein [Candidatus Promineifilaceae bacterium]|nr:thioredoxin domain-containing protein [Candidatus Promineifilaceae bacterium]
MHFSKRWYWLIILAGIVVAMAACGPAAAPESDPADSDEEGRATATAVEIIDDGPDLAEESPDPTTEPEESASAAPASSPTPEVAAEGLAVEVGSLTENAAGILVGRTTDGHAFIGDPSAPVVIQEFSDYQCPFCARFFEQTLPSLLENQIAAGEAVLVYYDFPLTNIHAQAQAAANAARCAGEQDALAYWEMHDLLFASTQEWSVQEPNPVFADYAETLELDGDSFATCLESQRYFDEIAADLASGSARGVSGTPSFFLNGQLLVGAQPLNAFNRAIATVKAGEQLASNQQAAAAPQEAAAAPTPAAIETDNAAGAMGNPEAPVTIVEYTDYQCPYCSRHSLQTLPRIITELVDSGRVYYVLKDFPLDNLHDEARLAATAARCGGVQDAYWEMHDVVFENQQAWAGQGEGALDVLSDLGAEIGLDQDDLLTCLESGQFDEAIEANRQEGLALGVTGTPSFFVAGYPLSGARPFEHFELATGLAEEGRLAEVYEPQPQEPPEPSGPRQVDTEGAYAIGDPDAPVTIVEFTDFQCPFCSRHYTQTYPQIVEQYVDTGLVRYVFKDFPLNNIHPQAAKAAEAARCAGDQEAYVEMHDLLFARQQVWSGADPVPIFVDFAEELGLDTTAFEQCLVTDTYADAVTADLQEGIALGITGTPGFFLNGYPLSGAQPFSVFEQAIQSLLEREEDQ